MKDIKLTDEDVPSVTRVYEELVRCIEEMPEDLYNSEKFALLVVQALMNMLCTVANAGGASKYEILKCVGQIWEGRYGSKLVLN